MAEQQQESDAVTIDFKFVGKVVAWSAFGSFLFVLFMFAIVERESLPMILAAGGLIPIGGAVVGGLLALSLTDDTEH
ncbi:MAG: hypothetical protein U1D30_10405 [Planctomycetota bacterium]